MRAHLVIHMSDTHVERQIGKVPVFWRKSILIVSRCVLSKLKSSPKMTAGNPHYREVDHSTCVAGVKNGDLNSDIRKRIDLLPPRAPAFADQRMYSGMSNWNLVPVHVQYVHSSPLVVQLLNNS